MMTLDEAINHCIDISNACEGQCSIDHFQLANWLKELRDLRNKNEWHIGTPTEKGMYYVTDGRDNYDVTYWLIVSVEDEEDDEGEWDSTYLNRIVAYRKLEPYKG